MDIAKVGKSVTLPNYIVNMGGKGIFFGEKMTPSIFTVDRTGNGTLGGGKVF